MTTRRKSLGVRGAWSFDPKRETTEIDVRGQRAQDQPAGAQEREPTKARARNDVPGERHCLRCSVPFWSDGFGERICRRCKGLNAWRSAVSLNQGWSGRG